jgi:ZIP family zinc transporter
MLPSSKSSLLKGGFSPKAAALILIACFIAGAAGIQILSRILHRYIPTHVVDCHHTHEDEEAQEPIKRDHSIQGNPRHELKGHHHRSHLRNQHPLNGHISPMHTRRFSWNSERHERQVDDQGTPHRPPLHSHFSSRVSQLVSSQKAFCDEDGQCYGYTDPCGVDCFRNLQARGGSKLQYHTVIRRPSLHRTTTHPQYPAPQTERTPLLHQVDEERNLTVQPSAPAGLSHTLYQHMPNDPPTSPQPQSPSSSRHSELLDGVEHHHHVPTNAFLSIGLQTCMAIALHKLPEGFITYATNHANSRLGFSVFLALFIHNITEGFAMALPLYLALNSKWKAIIWSSVLGGLSQVIQSPSISNSPLKQHLCSSNTTYSPSAQSSQKSGSESQVTLPPSPARVSTDVCSRSSPASWLRWHCSCLVRASI